MLLLRKTARWLSTHISIELGSPLLRYLLPPPLHILLLELVIRLVVQLLLVNEGAGAVLAEHDAQEDD